MKGLITILMILGSLSLWSQGWQKLGGNEETEVKYKWKENKAGEVELRVKLKNTSASDLNVDLEIGFYEAGVIDQSTNISSCLKAGIFNNWFRKWHLIQKEENGSDNSLSEYEIEINVLQTEKVEECEVTEP